MPHKKTLIALGGLIILILGTAILSLVSQPVKQPPSLADMLQDNNRTINELIMKLENVSAKAQSGVINAINEDLDDYQKTFRQYALLNDGLDRYIVYGALKVDENIKNLRAKEWENYQVFLATKEVLKMYPQFSEKLSQIDSDILGRVKVQILKTLSIYGGPELKTGKKTQNLNGVAFSGFIGEAAATEETRARVYHEKVMSGASEEIQLPNKEIVYSDSREYWVDLNSFRVFEDPQNKSSVMIYDERSEEVLPIADDAFSVRRGSQIEFEEFGKVIDIYAPGKSLVLGPAHRAFVGALNVSAPGKSLILDPVNKVADVFTNQDVKKWFDQWPEKELPQLYVPEDVVSWPKAIKDLLTEDDEFVFQGTKLYQDKQVYIFKESYQEDGALAYTLWYIEAQTYLPAKIEDWKADAYGRYSADLRNTQIFQTIEIVLRDSLPPDFFELKVPEDYQIDESFVKEIKADIPLNLKDRSFTCLLPALKIFFASPGPA